MLEGPKGRELFKKKFYNFNSLVYQCEKLDEKKLKIRYFDKITDY